MFELEKKINLALIVNETTIDIGILRPNKQMLVLGLHVKRQHNFGILPKLWSVGPTPVVTGTAASDRKLSEQGTAIWSVDWSSEHNKCYRKYFRNSCATPDWTVFSLN